MHFIMLLIKFEDGLFISVMRNKQLFTKNLGSKVHIFKISKAAQSPTWCVNLSLGQETAQKPPKSQAWRQQTAQKPPKVA
jgi:hypothetical protein